MICLLAVLFPFFVATGTSFYFKVNSVPVWLKGANSVPFSNFAGAVSDANVTSVLRALAQAGGNTLRVWGGGLYQRDAMYDFADSAGLLVWSEFAFACSMYPRDDAFLQLVRQEVAYQTRRLGGHPSILVFGGNNENEMELAGWDQTKQNRDLYLVRNTNTWRTFGTSGCVSCSVLTWWRCSGALICRWTT